MYRPLATTVLLYSCTQLYRSPIVLAHVQQAAHSMHSVLDAPKHWLDQELEWERSSEGQAAHYILEKSLNFQAPTQACT